MILKPDIQERIDNLIELYEVHQDLLSVVWSVDRRDFNEANKLITRMNNIEFQIYMIIVKHTAINNIVDDIRDRVIHILSEKLNTNHAGTSEERK